jgi:hypothetical protein
MDLVGLHNKYSGRLLSEHLVGSRKEDFPHLQHVTMGPLMVLSNPPLVSGPYTHRLNVKLMASEGHIGIRNLCLETDTDASTKSRVAYCATLEVGGQAVDTWHSFMATDEEGCDGRQLPFSITSGKQYLPFLAYHDISRVDAARLEFSPPCDRKGSVCVWARCANVMEYASGMGWVKFDSLCMSVQSPGMKSFLIARGC